MRQMIIDIETVGLKCGYHEITEISILDCQTMEQVTWMVKIKHPERASKEALYITKKTVEELMSRGRYIEEILDEVSTFLMKDVASNDEIVMIGHNCSFDRRFICAAFNEHNKKFPAIYWVDTKEMARKYTKTVLGIQKTSLALNEMLITANVKSAETEDVHSASTDTRNCYRLWKKMLNAGLSNSEFIKMDPDYMKEKPKEKPIIKKGKKQEFSLNDIMEEESASDLSDPFSFEEDNDD